MSATQHARMEKRLVRYVENRASRSEVNEVMSHLPSCESCQELFARYRRAEDALTAGASRAISPFTEARLARRLFENDRTPSRHMVFATVGTVSVLLCSAVILVQTRTTPEPGFTARGGEAALTASTSFRALRVTAGDSGPVVLDLSSSSESLRVGDRLSLVATSLEAARWVVVALRPSDGEVRVLAGPALVARAEDVAIAPPIAVTSEWPAGDARLVAAFAADAGTAELLARHAAAVEDTRTTAVRALDLRIAARP